MNCSDLEVLICDYVDGTATPVERRLVEEHLAGCRSCAEFARDAAAGAGFMERVAAVEPPPELVTRILFQIPNRRAAGAERRGSWLAAVRRWFEPVLQPRFAMGMAMTILSFAMLCRFSGVKVRQLSREDLNPAAVSATVDDRMHRTWARAVKYYENLRFVYEIQTRLKQWTDQEDDGRRVRPSTPAQAQPPVSPGGTAESSKTSRGAEGRQEQ